MYTYKTLPYTTEDAKEYIEHTIASIAKSEAVRKTALFPLTNELFNTYPASSFRFSGGTRVPGHHCYKGGILVHSAQVLMLALAAAQPGLPAGHTEAITRTEEEILLSCIWHDFAKIYDYAPQFSTGGAVVFVTKTWHAGNIHHIFTSANSFVEEAKKNGVPESQIDHVVHAILAHHGRPEWGSAVVPNTKVAMLLHHADMISARFHGDELTTPE